MSVVCVDAVSQLDQLLPMDSIVGAELTTSSREASSSQPLSGTQRLLLTTGSLVSIDIALLFLSHLFAAFAIQSLASAALPTNLLLQAVALTGVYLFVGLALGIFPATGMSPVLELRQLTLSLTISTMVLLCSASIFAKLTVTELLITSGGLPLACIALPVGRSILRSKLSRKSWWGEQAVIIGAGAQGRAIDDFYTDNPQLGLKPVGLIQHPQLPSMERRQTSLAEPHASIDDRVDSADGVRRNDARIMGDVTSTGAMAGRKGVRWAIIAPGGCDGFDHTDAIRNASQFSRAVILPTQMTLPSLWTNTFECAGVIGFQVRDQMREPVRAAFKRFTDLFIATTVLLFLIPLTPLFLVYAAWMQIVSPGTLIYRQPRIGRDGKIFRVWKFRTMVTDAAERLEQHLESSEEARQEWFREEKLMNDPRVVPIIGHFMRKSSLDELPQLINVFVGEMSIVGPRPRPVDKKRNERKSDLYPVYQRARPGITGLWQVSGRNTTSYEKRVHLDSYYVRNWSPWLDLYILIRTIRTVITTEGAC